MCQLSPGMRIAQNNARRAQDVREVHLSLVALLPPAAVCGFALIALKYYYDEHGPLSARGRRRLGLKGDTSNGAVAPTCTCTGLQGKAALLQPRSLKQPPMGTDTGSDGSEVSGMEMAISSAGGGLPTRSRRERRRSHDTLPM